MALYANGGWAARMSFTFLAVLWIGCTIYAGMLLSAGDSSCMELYDQELCSYIVSDNPAALYLPSRPDNLTFRRGRSIS